MSRSLWKGPFIDTSLLKLGSLGNSFSGPSKTTNKIKAIESSRKKNEAQRSSVQIWSRRSCILPQFVGCFVEIYNGRSFIGFKITEEMVGHKLGEFASTRKTSSIRRNNTIKGSRKKNG